LVLSLIPNNVRLCEPRGVVAGDMFIGETEPAIIANELRRGADDDDEEEEDEDEDDDCDCNFENVSLNDIVVVSFSLVFWVKKETTKRSRHKTTHTVIN
jgi:hypothetical protein